METNKINPLFTALSKFWHLFIYFAFSLACCKEPQLDKESKKANCSEELKKVEGFFYTNYYVDSTSIIEITTYKKNTNFKELLYTKRARIEYIKSKDNCISIHDSLNLNEDHLVKIISIADTSKFYLSEMEAGSYPIVVDNQQYYLCKLSSIKINGTKKDHLELYK